MFSISRGRCPDLVFAGESLLDLMVGKLCSQLPQTLGDPPESPLSQPAHGFRLCRTPGPRDYFPSEPGPAFLFYFYTTHQCSVFEAEGLLKHELGTVLTRSLHFFLSCCSGFKGKQKVACFPTLGGFRLPPWPFGGSL